jgi:diphosphomevalonate decarboxylase
MGKRKDGQDSHAVQIAPASHWPEIRNVIAITNPEKKKIGSSDAMELTAKTSTLYKERVKSMPKIVLLMRKAILERNLQSFLELAMRESSNMHAVMLDTFPPIIYLNDISRNIMESVLEFNRKKGKTCAGYTFDAGPNAHVYTTDEHAEEVQDMLRSISGVQKTFVCKIGNGPRKLSQEEALA